MILCVTRHGESEYNVQERYAGYADVPLTEKGIAQAKRLAERLRGTAFDVFISSSLLRARQTAEIIKDALDMPFAVLDCFKERNLGVYEGLTREEARERYPDLWERACTRKLDDAPTGGETIRQFDDRITKALLRLESEYPEKKILLVTHGFVSRIINRRYKALSYDEMNQFTLDNCEIWEYMV